MINNLKSQKGLAPVIVILIAVGIVMVVGGVYWWQKSVAPTTPTKVNELTPTKTDELKVKSVKIVIKDINLIGTTGKHPKFSNDGEKIVYREMKGNEFGLWIVNVDGTGLKKLTNELVIGGGASDFGWSPDDKFIFYKTSNVHLYPPAPTLIELKVIEVKTNVIKSVFQTSESSYFISPQWISKKEIAFIHIEESNISNASVKVVDVKKSKVVRPSKEITLYFWHIKGAISPDTSIIVSVGTDGTVKEITPGGALPAPLVFPDGKRIAYNSMNGLVIMNIDGSNPKIISPDITIYEPALSPNSGMFAYYKTSDDGIVLLSSDIYIMNVDGTGEKRLTESGNKMAMEPSWSPDGSKIAVFYYGTGEIGVIEIE